MTNKPGWLYEISFMRPILLVLLVSYHAFAPFCGSWEMPQGNSNIIIAVVKVMLKSTLATSGLILLYMTASIYTKKHTLSPM